MHIVDAFAKNLGGTGFGCKLNYGVWGGPIGTTGEHIAGVTITEKKGLVQVNFNPLVARLLTSLDIDPESLKAEDLKQMSVLGGETLETQPLNLGTGIMEGVHRAIQRLSTQKFSLIGDV